MDRSELKRFCRRWLKYIGGGDLGQRDSWRKEAAADLLKLTSKKWWAKWGDWYQKYPNKDVATQAHSDLVELKVLDED